MNISRSFICKCKKQKSWISDGEIKKEPCPSCGRLYKGKYNKKKLTIDAIEMPKSYDTKYFSIMTKNYKGIFIVFGKLWKGIYWHLPNLTIRTFLWGIDWYSTKDFNNSLRNEDAYKTKLSIKKRER